ncbi:MAG: hypothetical protein JEZ09_08805 [Salinivirgaceae bacterium]|nr:hypothetical protein [Salinivirgaceae bacterium]
MTKLKSIPIPIDERLSHLSQKDLEELFASYHYENQKVLLLFERYGIKNVSFSGLRWVLKFREYPQNSCSFHNVYSWQKASGRNSWSIPFCPQCKADLWSELPSNYFIKIQKEAKYKKSERVIFDSYMKRLSLEQYHNLTLSLKVLVNAWFLKSKGNSNVLKSNVLLRGKFFPSQILGDDLILEMQQENILTRSNIHQQSILVEDELFKFFSNEIIRDNKCEGLFNLWWEIAYNEIIDYLLYELAKKNLLPQIEPKTDVVLQYMIRNLSVQQCMYAIWGAIKDSCSLIAERNWDLDYASQIIPQQLRNKADRIIEGTLKPYPFSRPYACPQSKYSEVFFNNVTNLGDIGFSEIPNLDYFKNTKESLNRIRNEVNLGDDQMLIDYESDDDIIYPF